MKNEELEKELRTFLKERANVFLKEDIPDLAVYINKLILEMRINYEKQKSKPQR